MIETFAKIIMAMRTFKEEVQNPPSSLSLPLLNGLIESTPPVEKGDIKLRKLVVTLI